MNLSISGASPQPYLPRANSGQLFNTQKGNIPEGLKSKTCMVSTEEGEVEMSFAKIIGTIREEKLSWGDLKTKFGPQAMDTFRREVVEFVMDTVLQHYSIDYKIAGTPGPDSDIDITYGSKEGVEFTEKELFYAKSRFDNLWVEIFDDTSGYTCDVEIASIPGESNATYGELKSDEAKSDYRYVSLMGVAIQAQFTLDDKEAVGEVQQFMIDMCDEKEQSAINEVFTKAAEFKEGIQTEIRSEFISKCNEEGSEFTSLDETSRGQGDDFAALVQKNPSIYRKTELAVKDKRLRQISHQMDVAKKTMEKGSDELKVQLSYLETLRHSLYSEMYVTEGAFRHVVADKEGQMYSLHQKESINDYISGVGVIDDETYFQESDSQILVESLLENMVLEKAKQLGKSGGTDFAVMVNAAKYEERSNKCALALMERSGTVDKEAKAKLANDTYIAQKRSRLSTDYFHSCLNEIYFVAGESPEELEHMQVIYNLANAVSEDSEKASELLNPGPDAQGIKKSLAEFDKMYPGIYKKLQQMTEKLKNNEIGPEEYTRFLETCFPDMTEPLLATSRVSQLLRTIEDVRQTVTVDGGDRDFQLMPANMIAAMVISNERVQGFLHAETTDEDEKELHTLVEMHLGVTDPTYPRIKNKILEEQEEAAISDAYLGLVLTDSGTPLKESNEANRDGRLKAILKAKEHGEIDRVSPKGVKFDPAEVINPSLPVTAIKV